MKHFILKSSLVVALGLSLTLGLLGIMSYFEAGLPVARAAGSRYVAPGGTDLNNDCSDSSNPCATIQYAVDVADAGDVIKVAAGTYTGVNARLGSSYINAGVVTQVVYISKSVTIQGGYTTTFAEPPDSKANPTLLDAQDQGRVLYLTSATSPTIEGLSLTNGNARVGGSPLMGGSYDGGGVLIFLGSTVFSGNVVIGNEADRGGGLSLFSGNAVLSNNTITGNTALIRGGGVNVYSVTTVIISKNQVLSNTASSGGGLYLNAAFFTLDSNMIRSNTADFGAGLYIDYGFVSTATNNLIADNRASIAGSGIHIANSSVRLLHTTIANNQGSDGSGVHVTGGFDHSSIVLSGTILVSHAVGITVAAGNTATLESTLWYSNITNWGGTDIITSTNNYTGVPAFVDPDGGDYHLTSDSAAIDKVPLCIEGVSHDIDGETRPRGNGCDLGADEFTDSAVPILAINKTAPATATVGAPITYTLTITNSGLVSATNLVITDAVPAGAIYVGGGTKIGNIVSWTVPSLAANGGVTQTTFVVTATQTITNSDYGVRTEEGYGTQGSAAVVTLVSAEEIEGPKVFLPVILKP